MADGQPRLRRPAACCAPRRAGTLATTGPGGQPFASLVTPATRAGPVSAAAAVLACRSTPAICAPIRAARSWWPARPTSANPQTAPRVTVTGMAEPVEPTRR